MSRERLRSRLTTVGWALLVAPGALWAAVRLAGLDRGPLVQLLAFTPYVAGWSVLPALLALARRRRRPAGVAAVAAVALLAAVTPRAVSGPTPTPGGPALRVLTANLLHGTGDPADVVRLVRDHRIDVLAVQEFTPEAAQGLDRAAG